MSTDLQTAAVLLRCVFSTLWLSTCVVTGEHNSFTFARRPANICMFVQLYWARQPLTELGAYRRRSLRRDFRSVSSRENNRFANISFRKIRDWKSTEHHDRNGTLLRPYYVVNSWKLRKNDSFLLETDFIEFPPSVYILLSYIDLPVVDFSLW